MRPVWVHRSSGCNLVQAAQPAEAIVVWDHSNQCHRKALERLAIAVGEAPESLDVVGEDKAAGSRMVYSWWMRPGLGGAHRVTIFYPWATENLSAARSGR
jgi:hypothetical protein